MPCSGRCDEPIPVLRGKQTLVGTSADALEPRDTPVPPPSADGVEECVFAHIRDPARKTLEGYRATGGYVALERAVRAMTPEELISVIDDSGLAGRGGAGFPTGRKLRAVLDAEGGPKTVVCHADEGEPGCFKDRALMDHDPHALLEGMALACVATGAERAFIYLRYEYPETDAGLAVAIAETEAAGILGDDAFGSGRRIKIYLRRGAGAYICGEETSLLNSLEGAHPFPRNRPPYPVTHGYEGTPTAVNNVETLSSLPPIVANGAEWYRDLGMGEHAGTKVISLSGDVNRPGNYEVPLGLPLSELIEQWAGGIRNGYAIQAVTMAGLSGGFLAGDDLDVTLDEASIRSKGSFLGAGGIMVFDDLTKQAEAYRAVSLLLRRPPGREAYPGDVFYLHSRLLERCAKLSDDLGAGSMTGLPIIETKANDVSAFIPTNVISITDGQCFLESDLFNQGVRPAINVGVSVSRVGGAAQIKAMKEVAGSLRLELSQFRELESFAAFASDLDAASKAQLDRGARLVELLKQPQYTPYAVEDQVVSIFLGTGGHLDSVPVEDVARFETELLEHVKASHEGIIDEIRETKKLSEEAQEKLSDVINEFKKGFSASDGSSVVNEAETEAMDEEDVQKESVKVRKQAGK